MMLRSRSHLLGMYIVYVNGTQRYVEMLNGQYEVLTTTSRVIEVYSK
jgi:hypothetical protein